MSYEQTIADVSKAVEVVGIGVLIVGGCYALAAFALKVARGGSTDAYEDDQSSCEKSEAAHGITVWWTIRRLSHGRTLDGSIRRVCRGSSVKLQLKEEAGKWAKDAMAQTCSESTDLMDLPRV